MASKKIPQCPCCGQPLTHLPNGTGGLAHLRMDGCTFFFECGKDKAKALELWASAGGEWVK